MLATALAMNAQTQSVFASFSAWGQYTDGMNLYHYLGSNPVTHTDPSGQFTVPAVVTTWGPRLWMAYEVADAALSFKEWATLVIDTIVHRNLSRARLFELVSTSAFLGLDVLTGPLAGVFVDTLQATRRAKKLQKATDAFATLARQRQKARAIIGEVAEEGLDKALKEGHHMIPKAVLKRIRKHSDEVYKGVRGKAGDPNIFKIPKKLHDWMHSQQNIAGPGGWWNKMWMDAFDDLKARGFRGEDMIQELKRVREFALGELGIRDLLP